jgi:hypothetical protein
VTAVTAADPVSRLAQAQELLQPYHPAQQAGLVPLALAAGWLVPKAQARQELGKMEARA